MSHSSSFRTLALGGALVFSLIGTLGATFTEARAAETASLSVSVVAPANGLVTINRGQVVDVSVRLRRMGGARSRPKLTVEGLPPGISATFLPQTPAGSVSTLRLRATGGAFLGLFPLRVAAQDGALRTEARYLLNVRTLPTATLSLWQPDPVTAKQGQTVSVPIRLTRWRTKEDVTIRLAQAPAGVTAATITIPRGQTRGTLSLVLADDANLAGGTLLIEARGPNARRTVSVAIRVGRKASVAAAPAPSAPSAPSAPAPLPVPNGDAFDIGTPTLRDIWIDPAHGNDANSGDTRATAVRSLAEAWRRVPSGVLAGTGYRLQLTSGTYPENQIPVYWEGKQGTAQFPIILNGVDGPGTATLGGDINAFQLKHFYLVGFNIIPQPAGDAFHCEQCDTTLLRGMKLSGGARSAHETVKVNQSQRFYIEDSDISGAWDNAIDFVAVQYGHILRSKISNSEDWCLYVKGGSAYIRIEGNEIFNCGTGGFVAGQGTGFEYMTPPWIHYEAYGIAFVNNVIHDTSTAGMGVNGGYNILFAHNTLVRAGTRDHFFEANFGGQGCDGERAACAERLAAGGWGALPGEPAAHIPNRNIFVFKNLFYSPRGREVPYLLQIASAEAARGGTNLTGTSVADANLQIKGNVFWNGAGDDLGISPTRGGCADTNPTCNTAQLRAENRFNGIEPAFADGAAHDYRVTNDAFAGVPAADWPAFDWSALPTRPLAPAGATTVGVPSNKQGGARLNALGAY